jgi:hypothetical protein
MFDVWLTIIVLMFAVGVALRIWRRRLAPIHLQRTSVPAAQGLVAEFIESCYDGQFGFPTGLFRIEESNPGRLVAREYLPKGSHFLEILTRFYRAVLGFFSFFGGFGALFGLALAVMLTPFLLYAALTEVALRHLLRSEIVAELFDDRGTAGIQITLRGPAALLVGRRIEHAFNPPALPERVAVAAGLAQPGAVS